MPPATTAGLERNLRLYGMHQVAARLLFWFPTLLLFFLARVGLGGTLRLSAVYFLAVVVLEVPSGWFSDRFGRVPTIRTGAAAWVAAYATFLVAGSSAWMLALAQVLVALGFASLSGTDASFHFDTLEALGRTHEFEQREARASRNAFLGTTAAAAIGGALGFIDLRLPFAAALLAATGQLYFAFRMVEPAVAGHEAALESMVPGRLPASVRYLARPGLAWLFLFMTVQQPLEGLALDMIQPWIARSTGTSLAEAGAAPLYSGLLVATISLVGAAAAARSHRLRARLGIRGALGTLAAIETLILIGMAVTFSPWLALLLTLRSTQAAAAPVIVAAAAAPLVAKHHRATFLSLGSLAGRLAYGGVLLALGTLSDLDEVLTASAFIGMASIALLAAAHLIWRDDDLTPR